VTTIYPGNTASYATMFRYALIVQDAEGNRRAILVAGPRELRATVARIKMGPEFYRMGTRALYAVKITAKDPRAPSAPIRYVGLGMDRRPYQGPRITREFGDALERLRYGQKGKPS